MLWPHPFQRAHAILTPTQKEKKRKEAEETAKKAKETLKDEASKPADSATAISVQNRNEVIPPVAQGSSQDNNENIRPVAGPSDRVNVGNPSRPSTFSSAEARQDPGRSNPDNTTASDRHYQGGQSWNPSRAFLRLVVFSRLMTSRTGVYLPGNTSQDHLAQHSQSSASVRLLHRDHRVNDSESAGSNLSDGGGTGTRLDPLDLGDVILSGRASGKDAFGPNTGGAARSSSRRCYTPLDFEFILNSFVIRSRPANWERISQ